jgi:hypothetical protein
MPHFAFPARGSFEGSYEQERQNKNHYALAVGNGSFNPNSYLADAFRTPPERSGLFIQIEA